MTASKIFLYFCLSFVGGIFLSSFFQFPRLLMLVFLILGMILISVLWRYKKIVVLGFCILFLVLGIWRHQLAEIQISSSELQIYNDIEEVVALLGMVAAEPDIREKIQRLTIKIKGLDGNPEEPPSPEEGAYGARVLVTADRYPEYQYGDKLKITGNLKSPPFLEGFNYPEFLKQKGILSVMSWPKIELEGKDFGNPLMEFLFSFKNKFQETVGRFISPPQLGILEALFSGDEGNISKEWKEKLNITGTRHIAAVSGMNITIIASLLLSFLLSLGLWRQQAFYLSIILLLLYILMIGAPSSAVRAGIMGGLLLTAQHLGRASAASRAVSFAAFFMVLINPLLLTLDVGFQLSFLAILGIIYFQPFFLNLLKKIPNPQLFPLRMTLSTTLSAQIFTLPILVYNFGYIPLVSPITNILIVPFLAPITILIFIFGISAMIFGPLGYLFYLPLWFFLTYIIKIIDWFSQLPFTFWSLQDLHWIWLFISYLVMGLFIWRINEKQKLKFLKY